MQQSILIIGARGLVGSALSQQLGDRAIALSHSDCDITLPTSVQKAFETYKPKAVFNCAAMTNVDLCEAEPERALLINAEAVADLAELCNAHKATLVQFSTDYIFDGNGTGPMAETYPPNPLSVYGTSKLKGENAVTTVCHDWIVARVQFVFGSARHNFVTDTAQKLLNGQEVRAFSDQVGSPSYSADIARMSIGLLDNNYRGLFHVVNDGYASRTGIAQEIAHQLKIESPRITPIELKTLNLPAHRPLSCRLSVDKIKSIGINPPTWQDAISRFLHEANLQ